MSFSGLGMDHPASGTWIKDSSPPVPVAPLDYLTNGPGLAELQRVGSDTATLLATGKQGAVTGAGTGSTIVPANPIIAAIWGSDQDTAALFGATVANTMVNEQRQQAPGKRATVSTLSGQLIVRVTNAMLAKGDPSSCQIDFNDSMSAWASLYPALPQGSAWCVRNLILGGSTPCQVQAVCGQTLDAKGNAVNVAVPTPPRGSITSPPSAKPVQPPPTHAQIDAQIDTQMNAACPANQPPTQYCGESFDQLEKQQEESELAIYLTALLQARTMFTMALGLATNAPDAVVWKALADRGIQPADAIDWFTGCDADLNCFRQRMNQALGETDTNTRNGRSKGLVVAAVAVAAVAAYFTWRKR